MAHYTVTQLRDPASANPLAAIDAARSATEDSSDPAVFGIFQPLFGLPSNEIYVVTTGEHTHRLPKIASMDVIQTSHFVPTLRPASPERRTEPGIYVFRWFDIETQHIDEIARLSGVAWRDFEGGFDTEVQALFKPADASADTDQMLLITWYRDLSVWEASRMPSPEARENFRQRSLLTKRAIPIATRLV